MRTQRGFGLWSGGTVAVALLLLVPTTLVGFAPVRQAQERGTLLGPEERETLASWTERWLEGPVQFIATEDEKEIYRRLESTRQRLQFIRLFWERRDPTLRGPDNEYFDEFVRRVEYANAEFGNGIPGWQTVFGRVVLALGPPDRIEREANLPREVSQRPAILWTYDRMIPEYPTNEKLLFVYRRGKWLLYPPSNVGEPAGVENARRDFERGLLLPELPSDFERTIETTVRESLTQPVSYEAVVRNVEAEVFFPDAEIPFGYAAEFAAGEAGATAVSLNLTWRMGSLVFHVVDEQYQTEMVITAILLRDDGEPVAETSERLSLQVPVDELAARGDELVERTVSLSAAPGTYRLSLTLEDQLLGYRTVYRDELVVPSR